MLSRVALCPPACSLYSGADSRADRRRMEAALHGLRCDTRCMRLASALLLAASAAAQAQTDPASLVNPFIGTANGGNVFPGATAPFGMVQFSPEASPFRDGKPIAAPGGYEYRAGKIRGFRLTNVEG